jgi:hypothetical protein
MEGSMANEIRPGMLQSEKHAIELTRRQIEAALQLNARYFDGAGLTNFAPILQALATNFNAAVLYGKDMAAGDRDA